VFDQGPAYTLTRLAEAIERRESIDTVRSWWEEQLAWWSRRLDLLVVLDAPDDVLLDRVRRRDKRHVVENLPDQDARTTLALQRARHVAVVNAIRLEGHCVIVTADTHENDVSAIIDETRRVLDAMVKS